MTMHEYQQLAQRTSRKDKDDRFHILNGVLGLAGEAGECADLVKKREFQDGREIYDDLLEELGDVMWYVAETAAGLGVSLEDVAAKNIKKLILRYPEGFSAERSLYR